MRSPLFLPTAWHWEHRTPFWTALVIGLAVVLPFFSPAEPALPGPAPFTRITSGPIATNQGTALSAAWGDYDGDGFIDLFTGPGFGQPDFLYHNNGDGTFEQVLTGEIVTLPADTTSAVWGDYDNDGHLDLFTSNIFGPVSDRLYRNMGDGTFMVITEGEIVNDASPGLCATWVDYDRDGWLDVFIATFFNSNLLYRNLGDGTFLPITGVAPVQSVGNHQSAAWADYDNDGDPDLAIGFHDIFTTDFLFRNDGNGQFTRLPPIFEGSESKYTEGLAWGDYDNDGDLDLAVASAQRSDNRLYQNQGDGTFDLVLEGAISLDGHRGSTPAWADYDNDGWLDLFLTGNWGFRSRLYHNNGDGTFTGITAGALLTDGGGDIGSYGAAWGDYDNDGSLDLFVANGDPDPNVFRNRPSFLYHNDGNTNAWVLLRLVGTVSNRSAIGAKVRLKATIQGRTFWQLREITAGSGFTSHNDLRVHFGLGDAVRIEAIRIEWPSGAVQELFGGAMNSIHTITEPVKVEATGWGRIRVRNWREQSYVVEASNDLASWDAIGTMTSVVEFIDPDAASRAQRFYRVQETP